MTGLTRKPGTWHGTTRQASKYQIKVAELEDVISEMGQANAELGAEKEQLRRALPSTELLASDLRNKVHPLLLLPGLSPRDATPLPGT